MLSVSIMIRVGDLTQMVVDVRILLEGDRKIDDLVGMGSRDVFPARSDTVDGFKDLMVPRPMLRRRGCRHSSDTKCRQEHRHFHGCGEK